MRSLIVKVIFVVGVDKLVNSELFAYSGRIGSSCVEEDDCSLAVDHSTCTAAICTCNTGFVASDNKVCKRREYNG